MKIILFFNLKKYHIVCNNVIAVSYTHLNSTPEDYGISIAYRSVMGVEIPKISYNQQPLKMTYDIERSNSKVDYAYNCFYRVKQLTVLLAEVENSVYRLANTIRKTQKRANALKNISIPRFESTIKVISEALEEKEREERCV